MGISISRSTPRLDSLVWGSTARMRSMGTACLMLLGTGAPCWQPASKACRWPFKAWKNGWHRSCQTCRKHEPCQ